MIPIDCEISLTVRALFSSATMISCLMVCFLSLIIAYDSSHSYNFDYFHKLLQIRVYLLCVDKDPAILATVAYHASPLIRYCFKITPLFAVHFITFRAIVVVHFLWVDGQVAMTASKPLFGGRQKHKTFMGTDSHIADLYLLKLGSC